MNQYKSVLPARKWAYSAEAVLEFLMVCSVLSAFFLAGRRAAGQNVEGQIIASQYGTWKVPGYAANTYTNFAPSVCRVQGGASYFNAFTVGVPVRIVDGNPSWSETVVPSAVILSDSECSVTISPTNHHQLPFYLTSATAGLQEAINANLANPQPNTIILNNEWYQLGGSPAIIASVHGSSRLGLVDVTKVPTVWYSWNGSQYAEVAQPNATGGDTEVNDLFANNPENAFEDLYHFYATSPTYTAQNAVNAASAKNGAVTVQPGAGHTPFANPNAVKIVDNRTDVPAEKRSVKEWGAQCDAAMVDGQLTSGSQTVTLSSGSFSSGSVGMTLAAVGSVGGVQTAFESAIASVQSSTSATLTTAAPFTSSAGQVFTLGHDDTAAMTTAINFENNANNVTLTLPNGACLTHTLPMPVRLQGSGMLPTPGGASYVVGFPGEDVFSGHPGGFNPDLGNFRIYVDGSLDPTRPWQIINDQGTTSETPNYRPLAAGTAYANRPLSPGWLVGPGANGGGSMVGVGAVTQGSATMTLPTGIAAPATGEQILFPFTSTGLFTTTVSAVSGSTVTLGASYPGASATQEEWFAGTSAQNIQTAISSTQTMPFTITLANSIAPTPVNESNVAPYGLVEIDDEEFQYVGYNKASPYTITLTARAQNGTAAAAHSVGAAIVPLNPFEPGYPWPVTPTINTNATTPANASFYPGFNVGNCGICAPLADGADGGGAVFYQGNIHDIGIAIWNYSSSETDPNAGFYLVDPPYATKFDHIKTETNFGFVEGPPSVDNHPWFASGISGNANSFSGFSIHSGSAGMGFAELLGGDDAYQNFDMYSNGGSGFNLLYAYDDQTGSNAGTGEGTTALSNIYHEPGGPNYPQQTGQPGSMGGPVAEWDCGICHWIHTAIGGAGELYINGDRQYFVNGVLSQNFEIGGTPEQPILNYSSYSIFNDMSGVWNGGALGNTYGVDSFINWGPDTKAYGPAAQAGLSAQQQMSYGCGAQPSFGQTNETFNTLNLAAPYVNSQGGLICPDEFNQNAAWETNPFGAWTFDATSPVSQGYVSCAVGSGYGCESYIFDGVGEIYVGPGQRLAAGKYTATVSLKGGLASNTVSVDVSANGATETTENITYTNNWASYNFPVNLTGATAGANLAISINDGAAADTLELGYFDLAPAIQQLNLYPSTSGGASTGCLASPVEGIANSGYNCPPLGWGNNLADAQGATDTTVTLTGSPASYNPTGCFYVDAEIECYTGVSGNQLTGLLRGQYHTTPASHALNDSVGSLNFTSNSPADSGAGLVYAGSPASGTAVVGVNNPTPSNYNGSASLVINSGGNATYIDHGGGIQQTNASDLNNFASPLTVGGDTNTLAYQPITHSNRVVKTDGQNIMSVPFTLGAGHAGPLNILSATTIAAPAAILLGPTGTTTYSYECTGVDALGNTVGGTVATITDGPASLSDSDFISVTCPFQAGPSSFTIWRTAGGPNQGYLVTGYGPGDSFNDTGGNATAGTPPGTTSIAEVCINGSSSCWSSGSAAPTGSCTTGNLYTNTSGSPDVLYVCKAGAWAGVL